jgi:hypothetical protein
MREKASGASGDAGAPSPEPPRSKRGAGEIVSF